jgi:histone-lysine N-methyltransferase SETD3
MRKVKAREVVLFIPKSHLITLEMAKETSVSKKILQNKLDLLSPKHSFLSTYLLQERRNPNSFWKPYLDILPEAYSGFPIFFSEEELGWLEGSPFLKQVKEKLVDLHKDYDDICMVAKEFAEYPFREFCWARMTASSRIFGITINGIKTDAFVPLADMLNHRRPK